MGEYTKNLQLYKVDTVEDANNTFNIETMLNDNWDKIDEKLEKLPVQNGGLYINSETTEEDKAEAQEALKEIGGFLPPSNPNLLHNWYFLNPVNRKGKTEYKGAMSVSIDRWKNNSAKFSCSVSDDGLVLTDTVGGVPHIIFDQINDELKKILAGKSVTASALVTSITGRIVMQCGGKTKVILDEGLHVLTVDSFIDGEVPFRLYNQEANSSVTISAVKLELGDRQTLAHRDENGNWVLNEIPDYAEQMAICSQYELGNGSYIGTPTVTKGTTDLVAGTSALGKGCIHLVYE